MSNNNSDKLSGKRWVGWLVVGLVLSGIGYGLVQATFARWSQETQTVVGGVILGIVAMIPISALAFGVVIVALRVAMTSGGKRSNGDYIAVSPTLYRADQIPTLPPPYAAPPQWWTQQPRSQPDVFIVGEE